MAPGDLIGDGTEAGDKPARPLSAEEASRWLRWREKGDLQARESLIHEHLPHARMLAALHYARRVGDETSFDEYLQWASLGLIEAFDRFDPARGVLFRTYASPWIRGRIQDGLDASTEKYRQLEVRRRLRQDRMIDVKALADERKSDGKASPAELFRYLAEVGVGLAIGVLLEGTGMHADTESEAAGTGAESAYRSLELRQLCEHVRACVARLEPQEQNVIQSHYVDDELFGDIAQRLELSKGRVSQIHRRALGRLRQMLGEGTSFDLAA